MSFLDAMIYGIRDLFVEGNSVTRRSKLNFASGATLVDNEATQSTDVTIDGTTIAATRVAGAAALDENHLHAWELNEASGDFQDSGSGAQVPLANSGVICGGYGIPGKCGLFGIDEDGASLSTYASVSIDDISDLPTTNFSLEAWVCPAGDNLYGVMGGDDDVGTNFFIWGGAAKRMSVVSRATGGHITSASDGLFFCAHPGVWHHVAATYDGTWVRSYLDGELMSKHAQNGAILWHNGETPIFWVGASQGATGGFAGQITKVRMSNIVRAQAYFRSVYQTVMGF